jgi:hypothetical protein
MHDEKERFDDVFIVVIVFVLVQNLPNAKKGILPLFLKRAKN